MVGRFSAGPGRHRQHLRRHPDPHRVAVVPNCFNCLVYSRMADRLLPRVSERNNGTGTGCCNDADNVVSKRRPSRGPILRSVASRDFSSLVIFERAA